jgi:hypothetical protein
MATLQNFTKGACVTKTVFGNAIQGTVPAGQLVTPTYADGVACTLVVVAFAN